ncbi:PH and SEC7 domain-containing protein 4-like [Narcine bancroftii]|uniref:PH and SEC7 domain-containing protein 4-like n=1 Tax=Narcine bancroftii TaxID=1343680 RepID=UPI003831029E
MDDFDFLINMEQTSSRKDLDSTEGDADIEEDNCISALDLISNNSGLILEARTQDGTTNPFRISASPGKEMELGDLTSVNDDNEEDNIVATESVLLDFDLENKSTCTQCENSDFGQIETFTSQLTNIQLFEDDQDQLDSTNRSESASSFESNGSTPWVQAVLLTKRTNEMGNCAEECTASLFNNSDWMMTESPSPSEPLTPFVNEETDEELLRDKAEVSDAATTPDEIIMDPLDVDFLQQDVWHQNQAFIPILTTGKEELGEKNNLDPVICKPSSCEMEGHGVKEVITETCDVISTHDSISMLPSYIPSVHKELVGWNNLPMESEGTIYLSFGTQSSSKEHKVSNNKESLPDFFNPKEMLFAGPARTTYIKSISEAVLFSDSQGTSMGGTFRDHLDYACHGPDASAASLKTGQAWNTELLLHEGQEMNRPSPVASREVWSTASDCQVASQIVQEQAECTINVKNDPINCTHDYAEKNVKGMEWSDSPQNQEKEEITDAIAENDTIGTKQLPATNDSGESTDFEALLADGNKPDQEVAMKLAYKLYNLEGFKKTDIAPYIEKNNEFSQMVAEKYLRLFDFKEMSLDQALRKFLMAFALTGETQERERVLHHFSNRFQQCNPDIIHSKDAVHTITCALMLLNSDLHGKNLGKSMSSQDFITNLEGMNDGKDFPKDFLKALYHSIKSKKLEWAVDEEELQKSIMPMCEDFINTDKGMSPFLEVPHDHKAPTYKQGFLSRKFHADIDGKKTPWGKRSWKTFYAVLKGTIIYLLKDEYKPDKQSSEEAISIHHSLASKAAEYNKRPHVFRLQTADWRIFLFQAQSAEQMNSWITRINLVAAMFSSPPFPAAIGSKRKFSRPIYPATVSKQSEEAQLDSHDSMLQSILDDLEDHQLNVPDKKSKAKEFEEYKMKQEYYEYEKYRIETYVKLLKIKLSEGTDDLDKLEAQLFNRLEGEECNLKKSHSSPSLNQEQVPFVKVKRNVSERRTYRKIIPIRHRKLI